MNKKILTASAALLAAASMSFGLETWNGADGIYQIDTGLDAGTETAGYWFIYADDADGGASKITWPVEPGNEYSADALDPIIDHCAGVCGSFALDKGTLDYNPFVGIGFNVAGEDESGTPAPADASAWGGICITYTVDAAASIEMGLGDAVDGELGYDNPFVSAPKAASASTKDFAWTQFKQAGWGKGKITGAEAAAKLVAIKFKIQAASGTSGQFNIMQIGENGKCSGASIKAASAQASFKAQLNGRTLSFGKTVKAEIVNLQGQVVASAKASTMDLSKLQAGVYMVRAEGASQQIMVK
ncbi:MAG: T9SS type A sorting domain-containing protein [Fibrobacter sp.]|nr:T9SS type A sorting domain-containing protein [Fibrobacter sp.]